MRNGAGLTMPLAVYAKIGNLSELMRQTGIDKSYLAKMVRDERPASVTITAIGEVSVSYKKNPVGRPSQPLRNAAIRKRYSQGEKQIVLAKEYGLTKSSVSLICAGKR